MPKHRTPADPGTEGEGGASAVAAATPSLSDIIVRAIEDETPADERRAIRRQLDRIEAKLAGDRKDKPATAEGAEKAPGTRQGGRQRDLYVGALVDLKAVYAKAFAASLEETLPAAGSRNRRVVGRFLLAFAEVVDARLDALLDERSRQHFLYERPRPVGNWRHTLSDAKRRWNELAPETEPPASGKKAKPAAN